MFVAENVSGGMSSITNVEVAKMAAVGKTTVLNLREPIVAKLTPNGQKDPAQEITNPTPPDLTITQKLNASNPPPRLPEKAWSCNGSRGRGRL